MILKKPFVCHQEVIKKVWKHPNITHSCVLLVQCNKEIDDMPLTFLYFPTVDHIDKKKEGKTGKKTLRKKYCCKVVRNFECLGWPQWRGRKGTTRLW